MIFSRPIRSTPGILARGIPMRTEKWNALVFEWAAMKEASFAAAYPGYRKVFAAMHDEPLDEDADALSKLYSDSLEALEKAPIVSLADAIAALRHCVAEPENNANRDILRRVIKALRH